MNSVLGVVESQVLEAKQELDDYPPDGIDWYERSLAAVRLFVPWLVRVSPSLAQFVEDVLNSPATVREAWAKIRTSEGIVQEVAADIEAILQLESVLLGSVPGGIVSKIVERHLIKHFPGEELESNGPSDYPDLFVRTNDYGALPVFKRPTKKSGKTKQFGAAVKGKRRRPVRVPDGLEIKTCRDSAGVDCHYPHVGLHLILQFHEKDNNTVVDDIKVAFLRRDNYHISERRTGTTTDKSSFSDKEFVSILSRDQNGASPALFGE